jgi:glycerol-3-phosphate dehydrogenase (NAD+)
MKASGRPPPYPVRIAVIGGGNFGLALASVCARKGLPTTLLVRSEAVALSINEKHIHPKFMSDIVLPSKIRATTDATTALADATYIIHAVPVQYSRDFLNSIKEFIPPNTPVLSASKGIETASLGFMADILKECLGEERPYAFLSGPSFAREICEGVATAVVVASEELMLARDLATLLSDENFKVYTSKDVMGVEIGGAVKNVIALAAGMCEGLGLGTNAMSGLVTRGCGEMRRLGLTFGAKPSTLAGLSGAVTVVVVVVVIFTVAASCSCPHTCAVTWQINHVAGVGDTFGTCFGPLSRNRQFGFRLGKGETMEEILASTSEVAEGVDTSIALVNLIKAECKGYRLDLKYPILFGVASILQGNQTPEQGLKALMNMPMQMENFDEDR